MVTVPNRYVECRLVRESAQVVIFRRQRPLGLRKTLGALSFQLAHRRGSLRAPETRGVDGVVDRVGSERESRVVPEVNFFHFLLDSKNPRP